MPLHLLCYIIYATLCIRAVWYVLLAVTYVTNVMPYYVHAACDVMSQMVWAVSYVWTRCSMCNKGDPRQVGFLGENLCVLGYSVVPRIW